MDPAALAASVRDLASQASRVLRNPASRPFEIRALSRRITFLQRHVPGCPSNDLSRWLESLMIQVEASRIRAAYAWQDRAQGSEVGVG